MASRRGWIPVFLRALPHSTGVTAQLRVSLRRPACSWAASTFRGSNESSRTVSTSWSSRDTTYKGGGGEDCWSMDSSTLPLTCVHLLCQVISGLHSLL